MFVKYIVELGGVFKDVAYYRNELTVECPGGNMSSPRRVVQCCLKYGSGTLKSTFLDLSFLLTVNWNPLSGD